jgi:hypothetical protein
VPGYKVGVLGEQQEKGTVTTEKLSTDHMWKCQADENVHVIPDPGAWSREVSSNKLGTLTLQWKGNGKPSSTDHKRASAQRHINSTGAWEPDTYLGVKQ